jgi:hypothetical protein
MDFDIGNILYVVITLVAIVASLLGKKKKPAAKNAKPGFFENLEQVLKMEQEDPVLMNLQREEPDFQDEVEEIDYTYGQEEYAPLTEAPTFAEEYAEIMSNQDNSSLEGYSMEGDLSTLPLEVIELDNDERPDYFQIVSEFDARTAVIYSAIINRLNY